MNRSWQRVGLVQHEVSIHRCTPRRRCRPTKFPPQNPPNLSFWLFLTVCLASFQYSTSFLRDPSPKRCCTRSGGYGAKVVGLTGLLNTRKKARVERPLPSSLSSSFENENTLQTSLSNKEGALLLEVQELQQSAHSLIKQNRFEKACEVLKSIVERLAVAKRNESLRYSLSEVVDDIVQTMCAKAFRMPPRSDFVVHAVQALQLQLSSTDLVSKPFRTVPKKTLTSALYALTSVTEVQRSNLSSSESASLLTKLSFRILQRLITGVGVRQTIDKSHLVNEREINQVLNMFSNLGRMDMAHRIVALQERTPHAPPISPVAYSILLKGYGRQSDLAHVEEVLKHATKNKIKPDVILLNTLIDAYINCDRLDDAQTVFEAMQRRSSLEKDFAVFSGFSLPAPNQRTYNTMLKGLANIGAYERSSELFEEMGKTHSWDPVSTNTLVRAAVIGKEFDAADRILAKYTIEWNEGNTEFRSHPNVEAYTQLIDGYAKAGDMRKAVAVMQTMRSRNVMPNKWTYTCLIAGFGRTQQLDEAKRMLSFMKEKGIPPTTVTYNALISAILEGVKQEEGGNDNTFVHNLDIAVDQSLSFLRDMMNSGVCPNSVTAAVLVDAMGRCHPGRIEAATLLVEMLEKKKLITEGDPRVYTALIQAAGFHGDIKRALGLFRKLTRPDTVAVNAFIEACRRCGRQNLAFDTFNYYFLQKVTDYGLRPDIATYSILIRAFLENDDIAGIRKSQSLYIEMKRKWGICPDAGLVDTLLKAFIRVARRKSLAKKDVLFVACVLQDAKRLPWREGQLESRRKAIRGILGDSLRDAFLNDKRMGIFFSPEDDELFRRKGWNKVDSGFRLWGQASLDDGVKNKRKQNDEFLESHGWNDVDSGFRIL